MTERVSDVFTLDTESYLYLKPYKYKRFHPSIARIFNTSKGLVAYVRLDNASKDYGHQYLDFLMCLDQKDIELILPLLDDQDFIITQYISHDFISLEAKKEEADTLFLTEFYQKDINRALNFNIYNRVTRMILSELKNSASWKYGKETLYYGTSNMTTFEIFMMDYMKSFAIPPILNVSKVMDMENPVIFQIEYEGWMCNMKDYIMLLPYQSYHFEGTESKDNKFIVKLKHIQNIIPSVRRDFFNYFKWIVKKGSILIEKSPEPMTYFRRYSDVVDSMNRTHPGVL